MPGQEHSNRLLTVTLNGPCSLMPLLDIMLSNLLGVMASCVKIFCYIYQPVFELRNLLISI